MKFTTGKLALTKASIADLLRKQELFMEHTGTRKTTFLSMMTTYGISNADDHAGIIQHQLTMDVLFRPAGLMF
ncbi:hypothetical protein [Niabella hirudinis]|uniref:hypothetical protein n=1 Tax=Niabella hirudinis TaxID=1285929 RepID=UPI003EB9525F